MDDPPPPSSLSTSSSIDKTEWTEAKLATTAAEDQEWLAIKEESLFSNEAYFLRKYNDLADEDKQENPSSKNEEKENEGVCFLTIYHHILLHSLSYIYTHTGT